MTNWEKVQFNTEDWGTYRVKDIEVDALNRVLMERLEDAEIDLEEIQDEDLDRIEDIKERIWEEYPIERTSEMKDWRLYFDTDGNCMRMRNLWLKGTCMNVPNGTKSTSRSWISSGLFLIIASKIMGDAHPTRIEKKRAGHLLSPLFFSREQKISKNQKKLLTPKNKSVIL